MLTSLVTVAVSSRRFSWICLSSRGLDATLSGSLTRFLIASHAARSSVLRLSRSSALPTIEISLLIPFACSLVWLFKMLLELVIALL